MKTKDTLVDQKLGDPFYQSPEMVAENRVGPFTDIWDLGIILYKMCTVDANHLAQVFQKPKNLFETRISMPKNYSQELQDIILTMLNVDYNQRPSAVNILSLIREPT